MITDYRDVFSEKESVCKVPVLRSLCRLNPGSHFHNRRSFSIQTRHLMTLSIEMCCDARERCVLFPWALIWAFSVHINGTSDTKTVFPACKNQTDMMIRWPLAKHAQSHEQSTVHSLSIYANLRPLSLVVLLGNASLVLSGNHCYEGYWIVRYIRIVLYHHTFC